MRFGSGYFRFHPYSPHPLPGGRLACMRARTCASSSMNRIPILYQPTTIESKNVRTYVDEAPPCLDTMSHLIRSTCHHLVCVLLPASLTMWCCQLWKNIYVIVCSLLSFSSTIILIIYTIQACSWINSPTLPETVTLPCATGTRQRTKSTRQRLCQV